MPTYDYRCEACGHTFEEFQPMSAAPLTDCPNCHKPAVKRMMSSGAVIFKGSGFYLTDYKKTGASPGDSKDSKPASKPDPKPPSTPPASSESSKSDS
jgi:putative FmdB family regulatory protein